jgi:hypothetical protein
MVKSKQEEVEGFKRKVSSSTLQTVNLEQSRELSTDWAKQARKKTIENDAGEDEQADDEEENKTKMNVCNLPSHVQQTDLSEAKQGRRKASGDEGRKVGSSTLETLKLFFKVVKMTHNKVKNLNKPSTLEMSKPKRDSQEPSQDELASRETRPFPTDDNLPSQELENLGVDWLARKIHQATIWIVRKGLENLPTTNEGCGKPRSNKG